ncbi:PTS glucose transporter subunit IIA [[Clostridium] innocuum]|nr:PTS glucose transporter subunit IIA [Erysipelotrichaceae bacterium]MCR0383427.1 PTS glucose transporter subunit IIA [[Clostridium] innocuum]MCR0413678.1 PTS glucose transporter subunit IIA [[Clostridium] innocuum]MCR0532972.1 PTS glucose transporter subunit IIA [[Clostridium] innocuum]MCR0537031.1 PTS glucose transporter subunit IIA [[Clostridium] innocuum]
MFSIFQKKKEVSLTSCTNGAQIPLREVKDDVFASNMMGEGVAFALQDDVIYAPCDGLITLIPASLHAIGIRAENGAEILIHVGLDTVSLEGKGFQPLIKQGDKIKRGDSLLRVDRQAIKEKGIDLTTMMIITNSKDYQIDITMHEDVRVSDQVMICKKI